jgi:hypothetical protein
MAHSCRSRVISSFFDCRVKSIIILNSLWPISYIRRSSKDSIFRFLKSSICTVPGKALFGSNTDKEVTLHRRDERIFRISEFGGHSTKIVNADDLARVRTDSKRSLFLQQRIPC